MRFSSLYLLVIFALFPAPIFAYDDKTTHPALTNEIIELFNYSYPDLALSSEEKIFVKQGSIEEDAFGRWMRHFYDPVYNRGLIFGQEWQSSKDWAEDTVAQRLLDPNYQAVIALTMPYFGGSTDYSWDRAIFEYVHGDKKRGLEALGHILHLLEDASVPDHTRNDPHPPILDFGSPYEFWTKRFDEENVKGLATTMYRSGIDPITLGNLRGYFNSLAEYSNNNFFSKDTTPEKGNTYLKPIINEVLAVKMSDGGIQYFAHGLDNGRPYKLALVRLNAITLGKEYFIRDDDQLVLLDYWTRLSKQAVLHGAGVVKLFFDEVEKERQSGVLLAKNTSPIGAFKNLAAAFFNEISLNLVNYLISIGENNSEVPQLAVLSPSVFEVGLRTEPLLNVQPPRLDNESPMISAIESPVVSPSTLLRVNPIEPPVVSRVESPRVGIFGSSGNSGLGEELPQPELPQETESPEEEPEEFALLEPPTITSPESFFAVFTGVDITFRGTSTPNVWIGTDFSIATTTVDEEGLWELEITFDQGTTTLGFFAEDTAGIRSATTTVTFFINSIPPDLVFSPEPLAVVINEVAWRGTSNDNPNDEWIELFNNTGDAIDLTGWVLRSEKPVELYIELTGSISPGGYYLIERADDDTVFDIAADLISPFGKKSLNGNPGTLFLERIFEGATTTIDFVPSCGHAWCGGSINSYHAMERFDTLRAGDDPLNWGTNNSLITNGFAADGSTPLLGTPKKRNSVNYQISLTSKLSSDLVLQKSRSPYVIPNEQFTVEEDVVLSVEPGVVIKFGASSGSMFDIKGTLLAEGSEDDPIIFTSFIDDAAGDTNGDGLCDPGDASSTAACPFPGLWRHIRIFPESEGSRFDNTIIRYGGKFFTSQNVGARALWVEDTDIELTNSIIEYSLVFGAYIVRSNSPIENNIFRFNKTGLLVADNPDMIIEGNTFLENESGLVLSSGESPDVLAGCGRKTPLLKTL